MSNRDRSRKRAAHNSTAAKKAMRKRKKTEEIRRQKRIATERTDEAVGADDGDSIGERLHDIADGVKHKVKRVYTRGAKVLIAVCVTITVIIVLSIAFALYSIGADEYAERQNTESSLISAEEAVSNAADNNVRLVGIGRAGYRYLSDSGKFDDVLVLDEEHHVTASDVFSQYTPAENASVIYRLRNEIEARMPEDEESDESSTSGNAENANANANTSDTETNGNEGEQEITSAAEAKSAIDAARNKAEESNEGTD